MSEAFNHRRLVFLSFPLWLVFAFSYSLLGVLPSVLTLTVLGLAVVELWNFVGLPGGKFEKAIFEIGWVSAGVLFLLGFEYLSFSTDAQQERFIVWSFMICMGLTHGGIFYSYGRKVREE
ncbi:MAG: hypothetical protein AAF098_19680 [Pseudomonadota bacterium]